MSHNNPLVDFLRHYGPIAAQDNMYDERIRDALQRYQVKPIEIPPERLNALLNNFSSTAPVTTILTGTAGDGKTYHARSVFEHLGGDIQQWVEGKKLIACHLPASAKELVIVKDLSELTDTEKAALLPDIARSITDSSCCRVYLIAANDGQLLATWRSWAGDVPGQVQLFRAIESMLVDGHEQHDTLRLLMYNLSRGDHAAIFDHLIECVVEHPDWDRCSGCPAAAADSQSADCPIQINRERLRHSSQRNFRQRLGSLIELAAANDQHLPIRQLLLLTVNILLGDRNTRSPLLNCKRAQQQARSRDYRHTNPYANAFGYNLDEGKRDQYLAFNAMHSFGIGKETENEFDDLLVFGVHESVERFQQYIAADTQFGDSIYQRERDNYLDGDRRQIKDFIQTLEPQRQRLFFELDDLPGTEELDPWRLTVFRHGGDYLRFRQALRAKERLLDAWSKPLAKGLNRTFSGMMVEADSEIYLTSSGGDGRARVAKFLARDELMVNRPGRAPYLTFDWPPGHLNPRIAVFDPFTPERPVNTIELRLTHFEYLMRVASGSLPASFSRQCFEDFHSFKLRLIDELERLDQSLGIGSTPYTDVIELTALEVMRTGSVQKKKLSIRLQHHEH